MSQDDVLDSHNQFIDLFAGAGGFTWGWQEAGFHPLAAIDNEPAALGTYELNFGCDECAILERDLEDFGPENLEAHLGERPADLFAIVGGPPCQGWSSAGRAKLRSLRGRAHSLLNDPRNSLYRQFVKYVDYFKPPVSVMENVPGMLSVEGRNVADEVVDNFEEIGYRTSYAVVNARWFGVAQRRKRIIFLGVREGLPLGLDVNELESFGPWFRDELVGLPGETTVRRAINDLPEVPHGIRMDPQPYKRGPGRISRFAEFMREYCDDRIHDHVCRWHNEQDLEAFSIMREGGKYYELPDRLKRYRDDIFRDKYRKLRWDDVSGTVTAHLSKDCYTHIHPGQPRTISIREAARLQSFPDDFRFDGNIGERFSQIGNAVPPFMAWGIAEYLRRSASRRDLDPAPWKRAV